MNNDTKANRIIECVKVEKIYHDGTRELRILEGLDLVVDEGQILTISGPSGVGKSTLLHIMGTLDRPTGGEVLFRGKSLVSTSRSEINRIRNQQLGFVFQFYHLLPEFTALENVMMPAISVGKRRRDCRERAEELLGKVGLTDRMTHKPGMLSGGEQQRVAIARALFNKPSVVLADEPTGNLDERTGGGIIDLLWKLNEDEGVTLVIVSHDDALGQRAHRWVYLHQGTAHVRKA
ncbi:MAG: ABC transporter ATP-binding protein [Candidatus Hydrogenedentales bacterium]|jgi:lipoprotein-releasing system ATP-binding protein